MVRFSSKLGHPSRVQFQISSRLRSDWSSVLGVEKIPRRKIITFFSRRPGAVPSANSVVAGFRNNEYTINEPNDRFAPPPIPGEFRVDTKTRLTKARFHLVLPGLIRFLLVSIEFSWIFFRCFWVTLGSIGIPRIFIQFLFARLIAFYQSLLSSAS